MFYRLINKLLLLTTNFAIIPLSPLVSVIGALKLIHKFFLSAIFTKVEFSLMLFGLYFAISTVIFDSTAFIYFDYYRYDGNFWISYFPLFAFSTCKPFITEKTIKKFINFSFFFNLVLLIIWLVTKNCNISEDCSFGGLFEARNAIGGFLSILSTISLIIYFSSTKNKITNFVKLVFFTTLMLLTYSRGSFFGFLVASFLYFINKKYNKLCFWYLFWICFLVTLSIAFYSYFYYRFAFDISDLGTKEANVFIRMFSLWPKAISMFLKSPLFGFGVGSFNDFETSHNLKSAQEFSSSHAHHSFLHFLAELGVIGSLLYLIFVYHLVKIYKNLQNAYPLISNIGFFSFVCVVFAGFTEHRLTTPASMIPVSILVGTFLSHYKYHKV